MKKQLPLVALVSALSVSAYAEPTLYGKANVSLHAADVGETTEAQLESNASRVGIKGKQALEDAGVEVFYKAEFEVDVDGDGSVFKQRNIYLGVKGGFGAVQAGQFDTPTKVAQKKIDIFNDLKGDIKNVITDSDKRVDNIVQFSSPSFSGVTVNVALIANEDENEADKNDDGVSSSVTYSNGGLYLAAAYDMNVQGEKVDAARFVAQYSLGDLQFGALYEQEEVDGADSQDGFVVSAQYKINKLALKAQFGQSDLKEDDGITIEGGETLSVGADYKVAKNFKYFGYVTLNDDDAGNEETYVGVGAELKF